MKNLLKGFSYIILSLEFLYSNLQRIKINIFGIFAISFEPFDVITIGKIYKNTFYFKPLSTLLTEIGQWALPGEALHTEINKVFIRRRPHVLRAFNKKCSG